jgi:CRAL/TRIO domain
MTSWPWMKGVDVAIADPAPVDPNQDDRPSIPELILAHRHSIDEVKAELLQEPEFDYENKHDDLWILRFVLSHKKPKKAVKAAKHTLAFRKEHKLDERDIRYAPPDAKLDFEPMQRYYVYCDDDTFLWTLPQPSRGVITFARYSGVDQHGLVANVAESDWLPVFLYLSEWAHQWLDRISRTTGRLTKNTRLVDLAGMHMATFSMKNAKRDSKVINAMEDCYPQLLKMIYVVNPPFMFDAVWALLRPLAPKRVLEKFDIIHPATKERDRERLYKVMDKHLLPVRFGGENDQWPVSFPLPST